MIWAGSAMAGRKCLPSCMQLCPFGIVHNLLGAKTIHELFCTSHYTQTHYNTPWRKTRHKFTQRKDRLYHPPCQRIALTTQHAPGNVVDAHSKWTARCAEQHQRGASMDSFISWMILRLKYLNTYILQYIFQHCGGGITWISYLIEAKVEVFWWERGKDVGRARNGASLWGESLSPYYDAGNLTNSQSVLGHVILYSQWEKIILPPMNNQLWTRNIDAASSESEFWRKSRTLLCFSKNMCVNIVCVYN